MAVACVAVFAVLGVGGSRLLEPQCGSAAYASSFGAAALLTLYLWVTRVGTTTVTATGLAVERGRLLKRSIPWAKVASIDVADRYRGTNWQAVKVTLANGHKVWLPGLENSIRSEDPEFFDKFDQIVKRWEQRP